MPIAAPALREPAHGRLPQLDGLRAVAILLVLLHHTENLAFGWAGVHLFFVLSGFLITGILRRERHDAHYWAPFYIKRATRILPPLLVFFVFCALLGEMHFDARTAGFLFFGANIVQALPHARLDNLTILWSLAVEEHFYLLWPFAVRYLERRGVTILASIIILLSPVARGAVTPLAGRWEVVYYLTPFQLDGLALGALLALLIEQDRARAFLARASGSLAGGTLLLFFALCRYSWFTREANSVAFNALGYSLIVLFAGAALAHLVLRPASWAGRVLSWRAPVFLGVISYGLYLYHYPMMWAFYRGRIALGIGHGGTVIALAVLFSVVFAWASFRFYEQPLIRWGRLRARQFGDSSHIG